MAGFDPDKAFAELQLDHPVSGQASAFDPMKAAAELGLDVAPNGGNIQNGPSAAEAFARGAAQGATLGFGDELSAAASALVPTATDKALNRNVFDRYAASRDQIRQDNQNAQDARSGMYRTGDLVGSIPTMAVGAEGLSLAKIASPIYQAGVLGGVSALGKDKKDNAISTALNVGVNAAASMLFAKGLLALGNSVSKAASEGEQLGLNHGFDEFGNPIGDTLAKSAKFERNGSIKIDYGSDLGKVVKISKDDGMLYTDPNQQAALTEALVKQPEVIAEKINNTMETVGAKKDAIVSQYADVPVSLKSVYDKARKSISEIYGGKNNTVGDTKEDLLNLLKESEDRLLQQSKTGTLDGVPLKAVNDEKSLLGKIIFGQKQFQQGYNEQSDTFITAPVHKEATSLFNALSEKLQKTDQTAGSGGDLAQLDRVFNALYKMKGDTPTGAKIQQMADPQSHSGVKAFLEFTQHWDKLNPVEKQTLAPEMNQYLNTEFKNIIDNVRVMKLVSGRGGSVADRNLINMATKTSKSGLAGLLARGANAFSGAAPSAPPPAINLGPIPASVKISPAPALGALGISAMEPDSNQGPALKELK